MMNTIASVRCASHIVWLVYVSTPQRGMYPVASQPSPSSRIHGSDHKLAQNLQKGKGVNFQKRFRTRACWASTTGGASSEGIVNSHTNVQLYSLGSSPICVNEVEKSLFLSPRQRSCEGI